MWCDSPRLYSPPVQEGIIYGDVMLYISMSTYMSGEFLCAKCPREQSSVEKGRGRPALFAGQLKKAQYDQDARPATEEDHTWFLFCAISGKPEKGNQNLETLFCLVLRFPRSSHQHCQWPQWDILWKIPQICLDVSYLLFPRKKTPNCMELWQFLHKKASFL